MLCLPLLVMMRLRQLWPDLPFAPRKCDERDSNHIPIDLLVQ